MSDALAANEQPQEADDDGRLVVDTTGMETTTTREIWKALVAVGCFVESAEVLLDDEPPLGPNGHVLVPYATWYELRTALNGAREHREVFAALVEMSTP